MKFFRYIFIAVLLIQAPHVFAFFKGDPPKIDNNLEQKPKLTPCITALLDNIPLTPGSQVNKSTQGTITVENENDNKIFFNVILKTRTGIKGDPPIYLRFIKVERLDIRKVLDYAKSGDEIYIEHYTVNAYERKLCAPSSLTVT